jgi:hypothetical protein
VTAYPAWTPASRPGIIPLHPLSFGTILGRSFVALRQNPRVLLGFALVVQTLAYLLVLVAIAAVAFATFSRLDTLQPGTEEFDTVLAGSVAITLIAGIVLGLGAGALGVIVQGIVVSEVAHAAVAEKLTLGGLWQRVKPVAWRLMGYALLLVLALLIGVGLVALGVIGLAVASPPAAIGLTILLVLAAIPLIWWLSTKLLLTPAVIILERATMWEAIGRSWTLVRGRFWVALGVILVISLTFSAVGQVISFPLTILSSGITTIIAPTGSPDASAIIGVIVVLLLAQILTLLIQSVAVVVQSTATALVYIDCRMRREGLDLDLLAYVERRDAGATVLQDPYLEHIGRTIAPRYAGTPPAGYPQNAHPQAVYGPNPVARYGPQQYAEPSYPPPAGYAQTAPPPPRSHDEDAPPPPATTWAAPGTTAEDRGSDSPWP